MDEIVASLRRERAISLLIPLFFVSGATGLVYQTLWARELHLVFGTSTFAIATVLSAFMAGLAIGGAFMASRADQTQRPMAIYGWLEVGIGLYGVLFPFLIAVLTPVYLEVWRALEPTPVVFGGIQFILVGSALLLPTAFMGATLPLLARFATDRLGAAGARVGTLYAVNTAGAVFGTWLGGFVLLPYLGLWVTTLCAATANLLLGAAAIAVSKWASEAQVAPAVDDLEDRAFEPEVLPVAVCVALAGFASLVYEVAWFRLLGLMLGASVYAFSVMLLAFLIGIAIGGKIGGPLSDKALRAGGRPKVLRMLALLQVGVAVLSYLLMYTFQELPFWYVWLFDFFGAEDAPSRMWWVSLVLSGVVMAPPAILMGMVFPFAVRAVVGSSEQLGGPVGRVYAANTAGGVLGAALAGFVLLPSFRVQGTLFIAAAANLVAAFVVLIGGGLSDRSRMAAWRTLGVGAAVLLCIIVVARRPPWNPLLMTAGMYKYVSSMSDHSREGILSFAVDQYELLYYREGLSSVVTVARNEDSGNIWLANNGKVDASTSIDMPTQVLVSLLPMQFVEQPEDVLVIGLASGVTAGAVTLIPDVESLEVVELEPAIIGAARIFDRYNHYLLNDERTEVIVNDGRNHVLLSPPESYDVIISEPSNPWLTGVSNLFTLEFLTMGKSRLKPGGVWGQWVQTYGMAKSDLQTLLATFVEVYPHIVVYATAEGADLVLVGSDDPLVADYDHAQSLFDRWPRVKDELGFVNMDDPLDIVALFQLDREGLVAAANGSPVNTDDNMRIEYSAPLNLHRSTQSENAQLLEDHARIPFELIEDDVLTYSDLARSYRKLEDWSRAFRAMAAAVERLEPQDSLRLELVAEAEVWYEEMIEALGYEKDVAMDLLR